MPPPTYPRPHRGAPTGLPALRLACTGLVCTALVACGGGGGGSTAGGIGVGDEVQKPGGGTFFVDENQGGQATRLRLVEAFWGRLVDVHDLDATGLPGVAPIFTDLVISENQLSDGQNYVLETNPITQISRLVIQRSRGAPDLGAGTFDSLLRAVTANLPAVIPKNDDGTSAEPFSVVPRNATITLRFDDALRDDPKAAVQLSQTLLVRTGYPPSTPFSARVVFDTNHGALIGGEFHSTRILIDLTVSEAESASLAFPVPINALGLPESNSASGQPNVSLRLPTQIDSASGQFFLLTNLAGSPLAATGNGPVDPGSPTVDVVRALRSGNTIDQNGGFLLDPFTPRIIGSWPLLIEAAAALPGAGDTEFVLDVRFSTPCRRAPREGDILQLGQRFLEVTASGTPPDAGGAVIALSVRLLGGTVVPHPDVLLGGAAFLSTFDPGLLVDPGCWVSFIPQAGNPPVQDVRTDTQILVRFSEPMDPKSLRPFDTFRLVRGVLGTEVLPTNLVVGDVLDSLDLREFAFTPSLPLATQNGLIYQVQLRSGSDGITDLAGNSLADGLAAFEFRLDPDAMPRTNGGVVMRFTSPDELEPFGAADLRGQAIFDGQREVVFPRPVSFGTLGADRSKPTVGNMTRFPPGLQTPLSPLGSKMQSVWRYADVGWSVRDETKFNIDVIGLAWSPVGGQVLADFYPEFEMLLAHCRKLPDEAFGNAPLYPESGLGRSGGTNCVSGTSGVAYAENVLPDPRGLQKIVHPRFLGYRIDSSQLFVNGSGKVMMPYPMNRTGNQSGGQTSADLSNAITYTWRDTAVLERDGRSGAGIPMDIEVGFPLALDTGTGSVAPPGLVPSIGLPLLWEIRCYPSDSGLGLNAHDISLAINNFCVPNFRAFSTGGIDLGGNRVIKNPDLELFPSGGFNGRSMPPGQPTKLNSDNSFYLGQIDIVIKVSRAHTMWLDTALTQPDFVDPVIEPERGEQPAGTQLLVEYRGADDFLGVGQDPFDALALDFYGNLPFGTTVYHVDETWTDDIADVAGARYVQVRLSFISNIASGESPILDSLGLAWKAQ